MMAETRTIEVPVRGMDCADCTRHVQQAIVALPGVTSVEVFLATEKAIVQLDPNRITLPAIRDAVKSAGYSVPETTATGDPSQTIPSFTRQILTLLGVVFGLVLFVVVFGECLGWFEGATERVPWPIWAALVLLAGFPVFRNVVRATLRRQVISHTLMSVGVLAAIAVGQWATALVVVVFMRVGDYAEHFTTERGRRALRELTALAPKTARVERVREGAPVEAEVPVEEVKPGEIVVVRPGEKVPVDGEVVSGQATLNQSAITGESMPVEVGPGAKVFAATLAQLGSLRVQVTGAGADTTFGRVIRLVEEAEANRGEIQRLADRLSAWYLPVVAAIAALTFLLRHDPLAVAAVLVVACSCSFALATPIAMLASVGAAARRGILVKGGKYLEALARADVVLLDKTGTLTLGRPRVTDIVPLNGVGPNEVLAVAATAERYSEHPLAEAVRAAARERGLPLGSPEDFAAIPGQGVRARIDGVAVAVGSGRILPAPADLSSAEELEAQGKTTLFVVRDGVPIGVVAAADTLRPELPAALAALRTMGVRTVEMLTGDNARVAAAVARELGVDFRANLLPEDKIAIVKEYQSRGHTVTMVGDGVNDAPALAQADVGIAMGAAGSDVAIEAAHVALLADDWTLVPEVFQIAHRTMRVVKLNFGFTVLYNLVGLSLAALGFLPPVLAAAAQSLPDLGILGNSARLLHQPAVTPRAPVPPRPSPSNGAKPNE